MVVTIEDEKVSSILAKEIIHTASGILNLGREGVEDVVELNEISAGLVPCGGVIFIPYNLLHIQRNISKLCWYPFTLFDKKQQGNLYVCP